MTPVPDGRRDFVGYGPNPPDPRWPGGARLALVVVLNLEEGAEPSIPDGDPDSETALTDAVPGEVGGGRRDFVAESLFEYGSRVGFWRLAELFAERGVPLTVNACAAALRRNPAIAAAVRDGAAGGAMDLCCHGDRFVRHWRMTPEEERAAIASAVRGFVDTVGRPPLGWQSRYSPSAATRALVVEHGGFLYDADSYADDLPWWTDVGGRPHLVVPHSFTHNDNRLATAKLGTADDFLDHLAAAFRVLHAEGARRPRLMTVSLHARISGQPSRFDAVRRFLDLVGAAPGVWCAGRSEIARHWIAEHPPEELP
ncbi:chitin deacetylase [Oharaeibacter diazotrophicus]|uniref:Peptidoglycan/xylan/chitin deacetylase (PgdA/CDA1 family) n=1 Tax=Oharaeibacter diazotrophicus TaxID=1920512 RepID=A0A4R6RJB2_9HYPH|nr:chitin deacetylase [Oharaeibacter diazotrophicus]TDP86550.1 peptidoglycan/xylan/chitin deacetylase (PgdA/CDA1 family) [Oharaeibacter diazotrophicus]BBE71508.1 polysaccharide deacetylase [Pleomorphomonas sp. SM30]GLS78269.1 polysaccharide deacetylase [Oharaeibacter diazotrophicus]